MPFRRLLPALTAVVLLAACGDAPTATSAADTEPTLEAVYDAYGEGAVATGAVERAPENLRLTDEQRAQLRSLHEAFREANQADLEALRAIVREAMTARRNGASTEEVRAILERGREIHARLRPAFAELRAAVNAVLTDEQRAWLEENGRRFGPKLPPLGARRP